MKIYKTTITLDVFQFYVCHPDLRILKWKVDGSKLGLKIFTLQNWNELEIIK